MSTHSANTAARFRESRIRAGLSVRELAKAASEAAGRPIYPKTIHRIERGELVTGVPHMATVAAVAQALGVEITDLLGPEVLNPC